MDDIDAIGISAQVIKDRMRFARKAPKGSKETKGCASTADGVGDTKYQLGSKNR